MRCLLAAILLLCCSISYGQTSVIIDVPSPIPTTLLPFPVTGCACTDCECAEAVVSVEVERTGLFSRLCNRGDREGPRFLLKIFTRNRTPEPEPEVEVEGEVVVPPAPVRRVAVSVRAPFPFLRGF